MGKRFHFENLTVDDIASYNRAKRFAIGLIPFDKIHSSLIDPQTAKLIQKFGNQDMKNAKFFERMREIDEELNETVGREFIRFVLG